MANEFGKYLNQLRIQKGLSIRELARLSGISNAYISQIETGKRESPTPDIIKSLYIPLGVGYDEMMNKVGYIEFSSDQERIRQLEEELQTANHRIRELEGLLDDIQDVINTVK